jgi:hypothetical protein
VVVVFWREQDIINHQSSSIIINHHQSASISIAWPLKLPYYNSQQP